MIGWGDSAGMDAGRIVRGDRAAWRDRGWLAAVVAGIGLLAACAGDPTVDGSTQSLYVDAAPLPTVERTKWAPAPAGCEDRLGENLTFAVAAGEPELLVALDTRGRVVCVDTFPAIESELEGEDSETLDRVWLGYMATLQELDPVQQSSRVPTPTAPLGGDPSPQPNRNTSLVSQTVSEAMKEALRLRAV